MSRRSKFTVEEKHAIIQEYLELRKSQRDILREYKVDSHDLMRWIRRYKAGGISGLEDIHMNTQYPMEVKHRAIMECLAGQEPLRSIARKYEVSSPSVLRRWVQKYTEHGVVLSNPGTGGRDMQKARRTTFQERIEIVRYCLDQSRSYNRAAMLYGVTYSQVYRWVHRFEADGEEGLQDCRGKRRKEEERSPEDLQRIAMKKLEIENEWLRAENAYLKKLDELERRRF
jgi:transposase-like protein